MKKIVDSRIRIFETPEDYHGDLRIEITINDYSICFYSDEYDEYVKNMIVKKIGEGLDGWYRFKDT